MEPETFAATVAIPAYNEAGRIAKAIAGIRTQTEPPAEIIVVDDGSRDATAEIARSLGVRVLEQPNAGVSAARNRAIREAKSPWIAFCDADDVWYPEKLAEARRAHEARPEVGFIFTDFCVEDGGRIVVPSTFSFSREFAEYVSERVGDRLAFFERRALASALARRNFILPSTVLIRRSFLLERSIFFTPDLPANEEYYVAEDFEWYLRVLKATDALAIERVLVRYERHAGSLSENSGRVRRGDVKLGEMIANAPQEYVDGVAADFATHRRVHLSESAGRYGVALRFREMRARLREAQRVEFRFRDEVLLLLARAASFPGCRWLALQIFFAWRNVVKPALRWNRRPS